MIDTNKADKKVPALIVLAVFSSISLLIVLTNHYLFRTWAFDYASYNFAFFDYAHFRISPTPLNFQEYLYPETFLQDHFSFTLMFLAPFYWLMSWATGTYTMLILQWGFIVAGGWHTYKLIAFKSNDNRLSLLALVCYFVIFGRYSAAHADCNFAIIGAAVIPVFLYFFETKRRIAMWVTFIFLVFNREDYSLWLIFISLFLLILHRKDKEQRRMALIFFAASVVFFILMFTVFIPAVETDLRKYSLFEFHALGNTPMEALVFMIKHPLKTLKLLYTNHSGDPINDGVKIQFYIVYILSGGFLLLLRPLYIIPFIPLIAKKMFADAPVRWSVETYYAIEVASLLPVMVFLILADFRSNKIKYSFAILICITAASATLYKFYEGPRHLAYEGSLKYNFLSREFYTSPYDLDEARAMIKQIPENAIVSASGTIASHLAYRKRFYLYPKIFDAQYVLIFKEGNIFPMTPEEAKKMMANLRVDTDFKLVKETKDLLFYKLNK